MPFIVPGVCRYTINGRNQGRAIANVLDYRIDTTGSPTSRPDAIEALAGVLINEWCDSILPRLTNEYQFLSVSWVDLDEEDGSTGARTVTSQETLPQFGTLATPSLVSNVALLVEKNIPRQRGRRNGRMFINGLDEDATAPDTPNTLPGTQVTAWNAALAAFLGDTQQNVPYTADMVVTHILTYDPPLTPGGRPRPATGDHAIVSSLTVDPVLATQRRRLRG